MTAEDHGWVAVSVLLAAFTLLWGGLLFWARRAGDSDEDYLPVDATESERSADTVMIAATIVTGMTH